VVLRRRDTDTAGPAVLAPPARREPSPVTGDSAFLLGASYDGGVLFGPSTGFAAEAVTPAPPTAIPDALVPPGTILSPPVNNFVFLTMTTVKRHGKKFQEFVVFNTSGIPIEGRFVFVGLSLTQDGKLLGLNNQQLGTVPTFDGFPAVDLFLAPGGMQTVQVPAGGNFNPVVVAGL
jgi:hypothetical protein